MNGNVSHLEARMMALDLLRVLAGNPLVFAAYVAGEHLGREECVRIMTPLITEYLRKE